MTPKNKVHALLLMLAALLLLFVSTNASASATRPDASAELGEPEPARAINTLVEGGPGYIMLNPVQFHPLNVASLAGYNGYGLYNAGDTAGTYASQVFLPDKATITKMVVFYQDWSTGDLEVSFWPADSEYCARTRRMTVLSTGNEPGCCRYGENAPAVAVVVDSQRYSYVVQVDIPAGFGTFLFVNSVRIDYEVSSGYLPVIMR